MSWDSKNRDNPYVSIKKKEPKRQYTHVDHQAVFDFIVNHIQKNNKKAPSLREIQHEFDLASPNHARHICLKLDKMGFIYYNRNKQRGIRLIDDKEGNPINTNLKANREEIRSVRRSRRKN